MAVTRNMVFDAIKALAIWLVVLGHCVQYLSGWEFWDNALFRLIYSFHMPLFFMVSGFFFASSEDLPVWEFLKKKSIALLLPCFTWGIIYSCIYFQSWPHLILSVLFPTNWPLWFLKGLFLVQIAAYVSLKLAARMGGGKNKMLLFAILLSMTVYMLPYFAIPRVMMPIFWIGYIMRRYYEPFKRYHRVIGIVALLLFMGLYGFWDDITMCYYGKASVTIYHVLLGKHGYTVWTMLRVVYRIVLGAAGSIAVIAWMHEWKYENKYVSLIGSSTAGIYILQTLLLENGLSLLFSKYVGSWGCNSIVLYAGLFVASVALVVLFTWIYQGVRKCKWVDLLLFGSGYKTRKMVGMNIKND